MRFRQIRRGGRYLRVADPDWQDPLEGTHAKANGGRWNPPGSFEVLYLNADRRTARLNVERLLAHQPYGPEDLDPEEAFILVEADVPSDEYGDVITNRGCQAVGLPATYPADGDGGPIEQSICQRIGVAAHAEGLPGIACRSAVDRANRDNEELAYFSRGSSLAEAARWQFDQWFWSE